MARVLVADDDKRVCECLEKLIDWQSLECEFAGMAYNGEQAYKMIEEQQADILITDLKMPVMGGVELLIMKLDNDTFQNRIKSTF